MALTPRNIWTPDSGDGYALTTDLAAFADSVDDALDAVDVSASITTINTNITNLQTATGVKDYRWANAAARTAQAGMTVGDTGFQTDTQVDYWYSGSAWLVNMPGLNLIVPTSVAGTGTTVSNRGTVTAASATSVSVNGCFTSRFTNYLVQVDLISSAAATTALTLRASGTNAVTAYDNQRLSAINATVAAAQSLNTTGIITADGVAILSGRLTGEFTLFGPAVAAATQGTVDTLLTANPMTTASVKYLGGFMHRTTTAYDGFTFTPSSGNLTGTIRVYGYNQ